MLKKFNIYLKNKNIIYYSIFFILLLLLFYFIYQFYYNKKEDFENLLYDTDLFKTNKPKIWCYWETMKNKKKPGYIDLCYKSLIHNCSDCFEIIQLNESNIKKYLPEKSKLDLSHLSLPHKTDFYRYQLLYKYGGIWIDADIICLKCLCPLYKKLLNSEKDYMGFGCGRSRKSCSLNPDGKGDPTNWLMMSKPKTKYMKCVKDESESIILNKQEFSYHGIGKNLLKTCIKTMDKNWDYIHIPSTCQEYDKNGTKLNNIFEKFEVKDCSDERYFFPLYNTAPGYPQWFKDLSEKEIMENKNINENLKYIIHQAFSKKNNCLII